MYIYTTVNQCELLAVHISCSMPTTCASYILTSQNLGNLHADCQLHAQLCLADAGRPAELGHTPAGDTLPAESVIGGYMPLLDVPNIPKRRPKIGELVSFSPDNSAREMCYLHHDATRNRCTPTRTGMCHKDPPPACTHAKHAPSARRCIQRTLTRAHPCSR